MTGGKVRVWEAVFNKPTFRKQATILEDIDYIINTQNIVSDTEFKDIVNAQINAAQHSRPFPEVIDNIKHANAFKDCDGFNDVINDLASESAWSFHVGANWVLEYLRRYGSDLNPEFVKFEHHIENITHSHPRIVDVYYSNNGERIMHEFKSVQPSDVFTSEKIAQFNKDLQNADLIDEIKWIYDGRKLPNGLNPDDFIPHINPGQDYIDALMDVPYGQSATLQEFHNFILANFDDIFQVR